MQRRSKLLVVVLGVMLAIGGITWGFLVLGTRGAEIASILGLCVGVVGVMLAYVGLRPPKSESTSKRFRLRAIRPLVCLVCDKVFNVKMHYGNAHNIPCPRCGNFVIGYLNTDGTVTSTSVRGPGRPPMSVTYAVRDAFFGLVTRIGAPDYTESYKTWKAGLSRDSQGDNRNEK
jgi:hypothetical protein